MTSRLLFACFALTLLHSPYQAFAQFTDPRAYENTPVGTNQVELSYAYRHANASIDASLLIIGAKLDLNEGTVNYTRYFGAFHRLMWVEAGIPVAGLAGSINDTNIQGSIAGVGDSDYAIAILLKGGPALSAAQFQRYKPATTLGVALTLSAPTGLYHPNKILNLGSNRWSFKPELSFSHPFGPEQKWNLDAYANVYFYTDNTSYEGNQILRQQPLPGLEGHISYSFTDHLWASLDTRFSSRGTTFLDGVSQNNAQRNFILGSEMSISISSRHSLIFELAKALLHQNGPAVVEFSVKYDYTWSRSTANFR